MNDELKKYIEHMIIFLLDSKDKVNRDKIHPILAYHCKRMGWKCPNVFEIDEVIREMGKTLRPIRLGYDTNTHYTMPEGKNLFTGEDLNV